MGVEYLWEGERLWWEMMRYDEGGIGEEGLWRCGGIRTCAESWGSYLRECVYEDDVEVEGRCRGCDEWRCVG